MKRMISACLRFEAPDLWLAVPAALFPVLVVEVTALMIAATEDDPEALVLLPGVGMILTVVLCCVLGVVYLCSNFPCCCSSAPAGVDRWRGCACIFCG